MNAPHHAAHRYNYNIIRTMQYLSENCEYRSLERLN